MKSTKMLNYNNVKFLCGLIRDVATIDSAISDLVIASDKVWSSKKVSEQAIELKHSLEQYVQSSINSLTHLKKKIVDALPSDADAEENILYLVKDTSVVDDVVYNQYLLIDGVLEPLGRTSTDISNIYLKDEVDAKFALLSSLQTLINMVGNASDLETTAKDTLVNAINEINEIKEGLDNIDIDNYIKKDDIVTTYSANVTDSQVFSAKAMHGELKKGFNGIATQGLTIPENDMNNVIEAGVNEVVINTTDIANFPPVKRGNTRFRVKVETLSTNAYQQQVEFQAGVITRGTWIRIHVDNKWSTWTKVCTTSVPDVSKTAITITDETNYKISNGNHSWYAVENGWCEFSFYVQAVSPSTDIVYIDGVNLPLPKRMFINGYTNTSNNDIVSKIVFRIEADGRVGLNSGTANHLYCFRGVYKVAEN